MLAVIILGLLCQSGVFEAVNIKAISLAVHNRLRSAEDPSIPDLVWDTTLEKSAIAYAKKCIWGHSHIKGLGENLATTSSSKPIDVLAKTEDLMTKWVTTEKILNTDGKFTCCSRKSVACCHYTQVVWKKTLKVGCGYVQCGSKLDSKYAHSILINCHYTPKGNYAGVPPY